jgi:DNA-binding IclR family transcriptional regulator
MNKSLNKALEILEYLMNRKGTPVTPSELAEALELNAPTCIRILNGFAAKGYISQKSRKEGYIPGPALFALSGNNCMYSKLSRNSNELLKDIAMNLNRLVLISTYSSGRKYILAHFDGLRNSPSSLMDSYNDLYYTVSGRMLLSRLSEKELSEYVKNNGLPGDLWDGIDSLETLNKELDKIRETDCYCFNDAGEYWGISISLTAPGQPFCVLSTSVLQEEEINGAIELLQNAKSDLAASLKKETITAY